MNLTQFQNKIETRLMQTLDELDQKIEKREVIGNGETYIMIRLKDYIVWLYEDGAEFSWDLDYTPFEKYDYGDPYEESLIDDFLSKLTEALISPESYKDKHTSLWSKLKNKFFQLKPKFW